MNTKNLIHNRMELALVIVGKTIATQAEWADCWARIQKSIYKHTTWGAFIEPLEDHVGVVVGSIVEGVEWGTETHSLKYPFNESSLWQALEETEKEADEIWQATHGCEECGEPDEYNGGHIYINPKCPSCKGNGIII